jgi:hypothetical protein
MKKYVGRPWSGWEDNIEMDLAEVGWAQIGFIWFTIRTKVGPSEHRNELSDSSSLKMLLMSSITAKLLACQHRP